MQLSLFSVGAAFLSTAAAVTVSYDNGYDDGTRTLADVSCSDGPNGLIPKGFSTQSSLPTFPRIGGAFTIAGWNDPNCGTCYNLTYAGTGNTITVLAIDHTNDGFNIAQEAMDTLTNNQAVTLGRVDANYVEVDKSVCGL